MNINYAQIIEQMQNVFTVYGLKILSALAILVVGRIAAGIVKSLVSKAAVKAKTESTVAAFLSNMVYIAMLTFVVIAALGKLGIQTTSFIAVLGAAGLAVGLAFQGSLSNFAAGFLLVLFRPFKVGDYIEGGSAAGVVREIAVFTTTIMTVDNKKVIIPNAKITGDKIVNYTSEPTRRVDLVVGVSYGDDLDKVKDVLMDVVSGFKGVLTEPAPMVAVKEMADSSINLVVRPWANTADYWAVYFGLTEAIKKRFDAEGISIPFPQRDVHLFQEKTG